jgi:hypothetical protein
LRGLTTTLAREQCRKQIHMRAFGSEISAKEIDHLKMFDAFKAEIMAELSPANVNAQMRQLEQPLIRLRHGIRKLAGADQINALIRSDRFKKQNLEDLNEKELTDLRNTLAGRASKARQTEKENQPF